MIPDNTILVFFYIVKCTRVSIMAEVCIAAVRNALETRANKSPSTHCIIEGLEICLKCNNSRFSSQSSLIKWSSNRCTKLLLVCWFSCFDIDKNVLQAKRNTYQEMRYFSRYRDDCLALWTGPLEKLELFLFSNSVDSNL